MQNARNRTRLEYLNPIKSYGQLTRTLPASLKAPLPPLSVCLYLFQGRRGRGKESLTSPPRRALHSRLDPSAVSCAATKAGSCQCWPCLAGTKENFISHCKRKALEGKYSFSPSDVLHLWSLLIWGAGSHGPSDGRGRATWPTLDAFSRFAPT